MVVRLRGAGVVLALAALAAAAIATRSTAAPAEPPLNLKADNVTGSHGPEGDLVLLNGHVRITRGRTVITADKGRYARAQGILDLDQRVKMVDSSAVVTCDHASYSESTDVLDLRGNVVVQDKNGELHAPAGTYDRRTGRADLVGGVEGRDGGQRLIADRAIYLRDSSLVKARGHVHGVDDPNRIDLNAESIDFDRANKIATATDNPVLRARDRDGRVIQMTALKLRVDTDRRIAEAIDSVHVTRDTLQARADHALFDDKQDRGWLTGSPRVWDDETSITGDSIEIQTRQRVLQRVVVRNQAVMDYEGAHAGTFGEASRLTGNQVDIYFTKNDIDSLIATGAARNEYKSPSRGRQTAETNLAEGDTITVFFRQRKIDHARVEGAASGEYHLAANDTSAAKHEIVRYDARRIEYIVPKSRIVLDGDSHLTYQDLALRARRVEYDVDRQTLVAEGQPQLLERGDKVTGHLMTYDLESRVGTIYEANTAYERGLYHGEKIRKVGDNELDVMNGVYSTCDLPEPHFHFASHYMKVYLKDKLVAKPVVFYVKNVPLLALPFWVFPIRPGRHSGFLFPQFELGFNSEAGQFLRNAGYYWAPNDYMDLTVSGDYYQAEPSWVLRADGTYKLLYVLDGDVHGSLARNEATRHDDWDFNANHQQDLTPRTRMVARAQFVSSRDYSGSNLYGRTLAERLNRFLTSSFSITHTADWASFSAVVDRREDIDADVSLQDPDGPLGPAPLPPIGTVASLPNLTMNEPNIAIAFPQRILGSLGFLKNTPFQAALANMYFSLSAQYLSYYQRTGFVSDTLGGANVVSQNVSTRRAFASNSSIAGSRRLLGWLNFQPRLNGQMVVWDFDEQGNKIVPSAVWSSGVGLGTTLYGAARTHIGRLIGLRHILSPSISISYSPEFAGLTYVDSTGVRRNRFTPFGPIGISGFEDARMSLDLFQRLQAKLQKGDAVTRLDNLFAWSLHSSYNFLWEKQGQKHPFDPISSSMTIQPPGIVNAGIGSLFDPYSPRPLRSLNYNLNFAITSGGAHTPQTPELPIDRTEVSAPAFAENWSLNIAYSYAGGYTTSPAWTSQRTFNGVVRYQFSPGWGLEYSGSYDATLRQVQTQRFSLTRDLHCWQASFTRTFIVGGENEYYFRIAVKDQREIYLERGTREGSLGGIQ